MARSARMVIGTFAAVALVLLVVGPASAQLVTVYQPAPVYTPPVVSYYSPPAVYTPAPVVSYYAPTVSYYTPAVTYYTPSVSYYAYPTTVTTTRYGLFGRPRYTYTRTYP